MPKLLDAALLGKHAEIVPTGSRLGAPCADETIEVLRQHEGSEGFVQQVRIRG